MTLLLDHIFVIVESADIEVDSLTEFGFVEGSPSSHPGARIRGRERLTGAFTSAILCLSFCILAMLMKQKTARVVG